jgi:UDP-N-acetylmuramyl pentapeptide phosphotransferase/UDP-N-acetylglucosamine-1-phosphate transferase
MAARLAHASLEGMPLAQPSLWAAMVVAGCAGLSALLILALKPLFVRYLLARPNARSSHKIATPQGAGLAVVLAVLAGSALGILLWAPEARPSLLPVLATAVFLTILGVLDDANALPVSWRLIGQTLAVLVLVVSLPEGFQLFPGLMPLVVERALIVLGTVWFVNAVNFLDGLDWMTVAQVVPMTLGVAALEALGAVPATIGLLALALLGATLGFAIFNKHPAQIFLGDAGSLPIGLCLAFMLIFVAEAHLAAALLLSLYTLADPTLTLFRRILAGEQIFSAHRAHFYQRGVAQGLSVPQVTARVFLLGLLLAGLAITTVLARSLAADLLCLGLGLLATGLTLFALARGR